MKVGTNDSEVQVILEGQIGKAPFRPFHTHDDLDRLYPTAVKQVPKVMSTFGKTVSGVAVFVKKNILVIREQITQILCFDNITLTLKTAKCFFTVSGIYNLPQNKHDIFLEDFETLRHTLRIGAKNFIIVKFSFDTLVLKKVCENFRNMVQTLDLKLIDMAANKNNRNNKH